MKNRFRGLSESRKLKMLQMSVEEIYNDVYQEGFEKGYHVGIHNERTGACEAPTPKTLNQRRAELIQRARAFVEKQLSFDITILRKEMYRYCNAEFIVNTEKRTVVCLLKGRQTNSVWSKAKTKCHPGEVFNEWIGKAIALARALEIEIPQEFIDAVQPDEKVLGMMVSCNFNAHDVNEGEVYKLVEDGTAFGNKGLAGITSKVSRDSTITEDTHAEYEVPS